MHVEGTILAGRGFDPIQGRVVVDGGVIEAIEETDTDSSDIVCPAFVNAHTHIGDSIAKEAGAGLSLDALVAPPAGLKHRLLSAASVSEKAAAMRRSLQFMEATGTAACIDFREGDVAGVEAFRRAHDGLDIDAVVLGRESEAAMHESDGFGASGARDGEFEALRMATAAAAKLFGIHAGERDADDVDAALALDPDFLVHMVHTTPAQLDHVEAQETPIVVCPRSNLVTKVGVPPIRELADRTTVALGTDNVMLNSPSMFREMEFAAKLSDVAAADVLRMATVNGADIAGLDYGLLQEGKRAKLLVLNGDSDNLTGVRDPVRAVVRRAGQADVKRVVL